MRGRCLGFLTLLTLCLTTGLAKAPAAPQNTRQARKTVTVLRVNSPLTLDLTLNTDFAQVEADNQQNNPTRFSLFLSEKREKH